MNKYRVNESTLVTGGDVSTFLNHRILDKDNIPISKCKTCLTFITSLLKYLSLGKYPTKLYSNKSDFFSTTLGGVVSIICYLILSIFAVT